MKLSEAIRLGAMLNPQGFIDGDTPEERDQSINGDTTCALVAAHRAIGRDGTSWTEGWPWITLVKATCPHKECLVYERDAEDTVFIRILHLNDHHRWTREQIADWVETIERAQESTVADGNHASMEPALATSASAAQKSSDPMGQALAQWKEDAMNVFRR